MADSYLQTTVLQIINLLAPSPYTSYFCKGNGTTFKGFLFQGFNGANSGNLYTKLLGPKWPLPNNWNSRNVPAFIIDGLADERITRNVAKTFSNARSGIGDVNIDDNCILMMRAIYDGIDHVSPFGMDEYMKGVLLADPTLGLNSVNGPIVRVSGEMTSRLTDENSADTGGTLRTIVRYRFPIKFLYNRVTLAAMAAFSG